MNDSPTNSGAPKQVEPDQSAIGSRLNIKTGRLKSRLLLLIAVFISLFFCGFFLLKFIEHRRTQNLLDQARFHLEKYELNLALDYLNEYLGASPDDAESWLLAARTARRLEKITDAGRLLESSQAITGPTDATRLEWDLLRIQQGDIRGLDQKMRQSIGPDHPAAADVLEALALGYIRVERLQEAVQACELLIQRAPNHPWPYLWRGKIEERLGQFSKAQADFRHAVEKKPDCLQCRLALGKLLLREHQPIEAESQFRAAIEKNPADLSAGVGLAGCLIENGKFAEALNMLDAVRTLNPKIAEAMALTGKAMLETNEASQAVRHLNEAVKLSPDEPEYLYLLVQALRATNDEREATAVTDTMNRLKSDLAQLDEAIRQIARKSDDAKPRHEAGVLSLKVGRQEEGLRFLSSVLALPGDHLETHRVLSEIYRKKGDRERAEYHRSRSEKTKVP